jgi:hypothetical protein
MRIERDGIPLAFLPRNDEVVSFARVLASTAGTRASA